MRGPFLLGALALVLLAPAASAVTIDASRDGDRFLVVVTADDEALRANIVVSHVGPGGEVIDHVQPVDLALGASTRFELALPFGPSYAVYAAARDDGAPSPSQSAPPSSPSTPTIEWPTSLTSVASDGIVTLEVRPAFNGLETGRSATVFAPSEESLLVVRENVEGGLEATISSDGGRTFGAPFALSRPAITPGAVRVYWDETRFADGTLGVVYRQFEQQEPNASRDWTLARIDPASQTILARQTLAFNTSQFIEGESLEIFTLPNGRTMLLAETKDLRGSYSIDNASALHVWTLTPEGALVDETRIPMKHGILPRFETHSTVDGLLRLAWTHGATESEPARKLWTTTSTDGGLTFSAPTPVDLPFPANTRPSLASADIDPDGTLHLGVVADDPTDMGVDTPFYVRVPLEGHATTLDLSAFPKPVSPYGPTIETLTPRVTVAGDHVLVQWFDDESYALESLDGGRTFGSVMRLRDQAGSPFFLTDADVTPAGTPIYMTTSERCKNCFGVLAGRGPFEPPWFDGRPIELIPTVPPPMYARAPPLHEPVPDPVRPTPGLAPALALLGVAALALLRKRA